MNPEVDEWKADQVLHLTENEALENFAGKIEWNPSDVCIFVKCINS